MLSQFRLIKAIYDSQCELYLYISSIFYLYTLALLEKSIMYLIHLPG